MNPESHKEAIRESLEAIAEAILRGPVAHQRTIGFHCSAALADMLELYLHSQNLISPGTIIKHDLFASAQKARERLPIGLENRDRIAILFAEIEKRRNILCYGKRQPPEIIEEYLALFNEARALLERMGFAYE